VRLIVLGTLLGYALGQVWSAFFDSPGSTQNKGTFRLIRESGVQLWPSGTRFRLIRPKMKTKSNCRLDGAAFTFLCVTYARELFDQKHLDPRARAYDVTGLVAASTITLHRACPIRCALQSL
jgi:hypothetical protein